VLLLYLDVLQDKRLLNISINKSIGADIENFSISAFIFNIYIAKCIKNINFNRNYYRNILKNYTFIKK
jgi:hypothetical protein